jgi:hypothetical protein
LGQRLREPGNALVADNDQRDDGEGVGVPNCVLGAEEPLHLLPLRAPMGCYSNSLPRTADLRRFCQADLDRMGAERNNRLRQPSADLDVQTAS